MIDQADLALGDIKRGYRDDDSDASFRCLLCDARFTKGMIYPVDECLVDAPKACEMHIAQKHGSVFEALLGLGKKATGLTEIQAGLMLCFFRQMPDKEIAQSMGVAASTVRYQRHALREKARQVKVFLTLWEILEQKSQCHSTRDLVPPHPGATMVDDRYRITDDEADTALRTFFSSMDPLRLKKLPARQKKKIIILRAIAGLFKPDKRYTGREVDDMLKAVFDDHATLRRYLIEYGFMERTADGNQYWRNGHDPI